MARLVGLKVRLALFGILIVTLLEELVYFKPDCPILWMIYIYDTVE